MVNDIYGKMAEDLMGLSEYEINEAKRCLEECQRHLESSKKILESAKEYCFFDREEQPVRDAIYSAVRDVGRGIGYYETKNKMDKGRIRERIHTIHDRVTVYKMTRLCNLLDLQMCFVNKRGNVFPVKHIEPKKRNAFDKAMFRRYLGVDSEDPTVWFT